MRINRSHGSKSCTDINGAIIYDDLPVASSILQGRGRTRYKPAPATDDDDQVGVGLHLYSPEPRQAHLTEHLYHTISSGKYRFELISSE